MSNQFTDDSKLVTVENAIKGSFVKYSRLQQIVYETFGGTSIASATELNIFVDLYSILKVLFSEHNRTVINDYTALTSTVINLCGHYRAFFAKLSVRTKFYIIFSFNTCELNRKFVSEYNGTFLRKSEIKQFKDVTNNNLELMNILVPYLPDIHFVRSEKNYESTIIMAHIIENYCKNTPNLIISRDMYPIQLCTRYPYTSFLKPKKSKGEDTSIMLPINEKSNFREEFWKFVLLTREYPSISLFDTMIEISPVNFPLFSALNKFPERDIPLLFRAPYAIELIKSIVGGEDIQILPQQLYSIPQLTDGTQVAKIESRLKVLDMGFLKYYYELEPESKIMKFDNLRDDGALNHICAKFFNNTPINLSVL